VSGGGAPSYETLRWRRGGRRGRRGGKSRADAEQTPDISQKTRQMDLTRPVEGCEFEHICEIALGNGNNKLVHFRVLYIFEFFELLQKGAGYL